MKYNLSLIPKCGLWVALLLGTCFAGVQASEPGGSAGNILSLEEVVIAAQKYDPWLVGNRHSQEAIESLSISSGTLPDPKMSVGLANLPTDTFNFDQEGMTQFKVGVSQLFPRGDSLAIRQKQLDLTSRQYPYQREDRKARVTVAASRLWLDAYKAQESIALIDKDRALFEQLVDVAEASYSSTLGKTRQQDIIRAQLELTTLDDRLTVLNQQQERSLQQLSEWMSDYFIAEYSENSGVDSLLQSSSLVLARDMPDIDMLNPALYLATTATSPQTLFEYMSGHPGLTALERKIDASVAGIELAEQKYKPEWGINASYAYRDDDPLAGDRADFFSLGITFDIPLFTSNRQDKEYQSAVSRSAAVRTEKWQLVRKLVASFEAARTQLRRLNERQSLYRNLLLPQTHEQAEASLTAYTNDDGDFAEVVRARIAELNANIDALSIDVDRQKTIIQMNYFLMTSANEVAVTRHSPGVKR